MQEKSQNHFNSPIFGQRWLIDFFSGTHESPSGQGKGPPNVRKGMYVEKWSARPVRLEGIYMCITSYQLKLSYFQRRKIQTTMARSTEIWDIWLSSSVSRVPSMLAPTFRQIELFLYCQHVNFVEKTFWEWHFENIAKLLQSRDRWNFIFCFLWSLPFCLVCVLAFSTKVSIYYVQGHWQDELRELLPEAEDLTCDVAGVASALDDLMC